MNKIITLCGSTKFKNTFRGVEKQLLLKGWIVLSLNYWDRTEDNTEIKEFLTKMHYKKIDLSSAIFVINVDGYIGKSTSNEIQYAKKHNKEIFYLE